MRVRASVFYGGPGAIRTHDLPLRRRLLYPAELRGPRGSFYTPDEAFLQPFCRNDRIAISPA